MRNLLLAMLLAAAACSSSDPTFMKVCPVNDTFIYPVGEDTVSTACDSPLEITWLAMPLKVAVDPELDVDYADSFNEAFSFWERGVGSVMFVRANSDADVVIVLGSANDPGLAATSHHFVNGKLTATIEIRKPGDINEMVYVAAHELGHVVGLAHDPNSTSIMNSTIENVGLLNDDPDHPFPNLWVTDTDHDALRALYF